MLCVLDASNPSRASFRGILACTICLILSISAPAIGHTDQLFWQPLVTKSEPFVMPNMVGNSQNESTPCPPTASVVPITETPPVISRFATLPLDGYVVSIAWSPDRKYLAAGENLGARSIKVFNFPDMTVKKTIIKKTGWGGQQVAFTHDSKYLITTNIGIYDGFNPTAFSMIDINSGSLVREVPGFSSPPRYPLANVADNFIFSPDGRYLFAHFSGDLIHFYTYQTTNWSIISKTEIGISPMAPGPGSSEITYLIQGYAVGDAGKRDDMANLLIWSGVKKTLNFRSELFQYAIFRAKTLSINEADCAIALGASSVNTITQKITHTKTVYTAFTAIQKPENAIKIWYPNKNSILDIGASTPIQEMSLDPKAPLLAYIDGNNKIVLLFLPNSPGRSSKIVTLGSFKTEAMDLTFSPDGKFLAAAGDSQIIIYKVGE